MKKAFFAEFLGTFCLVFCGTGAIVIDSLTQGGVTHVGIAFTFGLIVLSMIYAFGDISGAHLNPAVTLGFLSARRISAHRAFGYIIFQVLGGLLASYILFLLFGNVASLGATLPAYSSGQSFGLELILTWILMLVILCVSTGSKEVGTMAGIAVGGIIALEALFAGPISGASMNPARSLAPALLSGNFQSLWVYVTAPFLGAVLAVICWTFLKTESGGSNR